MLRLVMLGLALSGCVKFVSNQPRTVLFADQGHETVRAILIRSIDQRRIVARQDHNGVIVGTSDRSAVPCTFTLTYTDQQAVVATEGPLAPDDATQIDARCDDLGAKLVKTIQSEVTRPERLARKAEKRRRKQEEIDARNQAYAAHAAYVREQQNLQPPPPPAPGFVAPPPPAPVAPAPARSSQPQPQSRPPPRAPGSSPSRTWNPQTSITRHNAAPPPQPARPTLQPNTCCVQRRAYLCPSTLVYAAACVQKTTPLATACPAAPLLPVNARLRDSRARPWRAPGR